MSFDSDDAGSNSRSTASPSLSGASPKVDSSQTSDTARNTSVFCVFDMDPINATSNELNSVNCTSVNQINSSDKFSKPNGYTHVTSVTEPDCSSVETDRFGLDGNCINSLSASALTATKVLSADNVEEQQLYLRDNIVGNEPNKLAADSDSIKSNNSVTSADSLSRYVFHCAIISISC